MVIVNAQNPCCNILVAGLERQDALKYMAAVYAAMEANPAIEFSHLAGDPIAYAKRFVNDQGREADCSGLSSNDSACIFSRMTLRIRCMDAFAQEADPEELCFDSALFLADTITWHRWDKLLLYLRGRLSENAPVVLLATDSDQVVNRILSQNESLSTASQILLAHDSFRSGRPASEYEMDVFDQTLRMRLSGDMDFELLNKKLALLHSKPHCRWFSCDVFQGQANEYGRYPMSSQSAYEEAFLWILSMMQLYPYQA